MSKGPKRATEDTTRQVPHGHSGVFSTLGLQNADEKYDALREVNGYQYTIAPIAKFEARAAKHRLERLLGGDANNPKFAPDLFDRTRERLQMLDKKERQNMMEAIGLLYSQRLATNFVANKEVDHPAFERLFYPRDLPTYKEVLHGLSLKPHFPYWKQANFSTLENLSRLPLDTLDYEKEATFSFEDWYSLFWNYYTPFNLSNYLHMLTNQNVFLTKEFVGDFAEYLVDRLKFIGSEHKSADIKSPIVVLGARTGNLAGHLNETNKLPVPVIACHDRPNMNPYLLAIPPEKQKAFQPYPMQRLKWEQAIEKYQPSIVLLTELEPNKDQTAMIRGCGCVREYIHVGMGDSYLEGNGWETWGNPRFRPEGDTRMKPPYADGGWGKATLPHLSRYLVHKMDSDLASGFGSATSFARNGLLPPPREQVRRVLRRIITRY